MLLLLIACHSLPTLHLHASPKADTAPADSPADTGQTGDTGNTGSDTGKDTSDTADSTDSSGTSSDTSGDTAVGRQGKSAAELAGEPGGLGCSHASSFGFWSLLPALFFIVRRKR